MLASLTIFFFCAGNPGNGSSTYLEFEVYYIYILKKNLSYGKKIYPLSTLPLFFSYLNKHVHFTPVLLFGVKYKPKQNVILF